MRTHKEDATIFPRVSLWHMARLWAEFSSYTHLYHRVCHSTLNGPLPSGTLNQGSDPGLHCWWPRSPRLSFCGSPQPWCSPARREGGDMKQVIRSQMFHTQEQKSWAAILWTQLRWTGIALTGECMRLYLSCSCDFGAIWHKDSFGIHKVDLI